MITCRVFFGQKWLKKGVLESSSISLMEVRISRVLVVEKRLVDQRLEMQLRIVEVWSESKI